MYDVDARKIVLMSASKQKKWAGAGKVPFSLPIPEEIWRIQSEPEGALVHTDEGVIGQTTLTRRMYITSGFFIVVRLNNFPDCTDTNGRITTSGGVKVLSCKFE